MLRALFTVLLTCLIGQLTSCKTRQVSQKASSASTSNSVKLVSPTAKAKKTKAELDKQSKTHFLVLGGGYSAKGNQLSLEKNVLFMDELLAFKIPHKTSYRLFADGKKGERSLKFKAGDTYPSEFQKMLISCFVDESTVNYSYRAHKVSKAADSLTRVNIDRYFESHGQKLVKGDRLICYFTGHGAKGLKSDEINTGLHMWQDGVYRMKDFATKVQSLPAGVEVIFVMVQCYSGGFQNVVYKNGDPKKGLAEQQVAGFYSTIHNRISAGCSSEINKKSFQEYSSWFWRALTSRFSQVPTIDCDYDGDGEVSFEEAHAYTIMNLDSVDIPTMTSEVVLRRHLPAKSKRVLNITKNSQLSEYLKIASILQKRIIEALLEKTGKGTELTIPSLVAESNKLFDHIASIEKKYEGNKRSLKVLKVKVAKLLKYHYPEVLNEWNINKFKIFHKKDVLLNKILSKSADFQKFQKLYLLQKSLKEKSKKLDRQWVYRNRLLRQMENVLFELYFLEGVSSFHKHKYLNMRQLEKSSL
ncbi:MAG: caspase family protein [Lentisphaeraceae bacterium]|nr:caspase family protein [Lentisphaeraceae bacterium]